MEQVGPLSVKTILEVLALITVLGSAFAAWFTLKNRVSSAEGKMEAMKTEIDTRREEQAAINRENKVSIMSLRESFAKVDVTLARVDERTRHISEMVEKLHNKS